MFDFTPLPHWTGSSWQGGESLPDETLGWCLLNAQGGHPHKGHAAIRCWTASSSAQMRIEGQLGHGSDQGDGIRGRIYSSRLGLLGDFRVQNGEAATALETVAVEPGDRLSFVVDCCDDHGFDSFRWPVTITETGNGQGSWSSSKEFGGPAESRLDKQIVFAWWLAYQRPPARTSTNRWRLGLLGKSRSTRRLRTERQR